MKDKIFNSLADTEPDTCSPEQGDHVIALAFAVLFTKQRFPTLARTMEDSIPNCGAKGASRDLMEYRHKRNDDDRRRDLERAELYSNLFFPRRGY